MTDNLASHQLPSAAAFMDCRDQHHSERFPRARRDILQAIGVCSHYTVVIYWLVEDNNTIFYVIRDCQEIRDCQDHEYYLWV